VLIVGGVPAVDVARPTFKLDRVNAVEIRCLEPLEQALILAGLEERVVMHPAFSRPRPRICQSICQRLFCQSICQPISGPETNKPLVF
jgi:hypothetical protein